MGGLGEGGGGRGAPVDLFFGEVLVLVWTFGSFVLTGRCVLRASFLLRSWEENGSMERAGLLACVLLFFPFDFWGRKVGMGSNLNHVPPFLPTIFSFLHY